MKYYLLSLFGLLFSGVVLAQNLKWKEVQTPVKASLRGLSPVSDLVCWASGSGGTWLKTTDGGVTWTHGVIAGLDTVDFRSIQAFDKLTAVAVSAGQPAVIYRTTDGGESWKKVHQEGPEAFFDGITFTDRSTGFILGDPVEGKWMILETKDGGKSWKAMDHLPDAELGEAAFAASASSMISSQDQLIFGTGGSVSNLYFFNFKDKSWSKTKTGMLQGESSQGIFALVKMNRGLLAVGGDYTKLDQRDLNALILNDGESQIPEILPLGFRSGVVYWEEKHMAVTVGPSGSDVSRDEGRTWANFSAIGYHSVKISPQKRTVWASGSNGRVGILIY